MAGMPGAVAFTHPWPRFAGGFPAFGGKRALVSEGALFACEFWTGGQLCVLPFFELRALCGFAILDALPRGGRGSHRELAPELFGVVANRNTGIPPGGRYSSEIPTRERGAALLKSLRERRSDIADVFEFMPLTGVRWGELRVICVSWMGEAPLLQLNVERSRSDGYHEKDPKCWRGTRSIPLSPRAQAIFRTHGAGKSPNDYLFTNRCDGQLAVGVAC